MVLTIDSQFRSSKQAQAFLEAQGYTIHMEASNLPVKFERKGEPTVTIASDTKGHSYVIVPYPSDKEIFKLLHKVWKDR